jgi:hypothetical protein
VLTNGELVWLSLRDSGFFYLEFFAVLDIYCISTYIYHKAENLVFVNALDCVVSNHGV